MAVVAAVGLLAWAAGSEFPLWPGEAAMLLAAALGLAGLQGREPEHPRRRLVWPAAALIAIAAGFELMWGMLGGAGEPPSMVGATAAYRAVSSGSAFLLLATALAMAAARDARAARYARALALAVAGVALVALVDRSLRALRLESVVPAVGLAPLVALGLLAGSAALLALRPAPRMLEMLRHAGLGRLVLLRLLPPAIALPILAGWIQFLGHPPGDFEATPGQALATILIIVACAALVLWATERLNELIARGALAALYGDGHGEWLEVTLASIDDAVITAGRDGRVGLANHAAEALLGIPAGTAVGSPVDELVKLEDETEGSPLACPLSEALATQEPAVAPGEPTLLLADGGRRAVEASAQPICAADGSLVGGVLVLRDVGARRAREHALREANVELDRRVEEGTQALARATEALSESAALLETFAAGTPELIIAKDRSGRITLINPAALRALGLTREQALGHSKTELFGESEETRHIYRSDQQVLETGQPVVVEEHLATPRGLRSFSVTKSPLRDEHGRIFGLVGVATDITERKQAQEELEQLLLDEHRRRGEAEQANRAKDEFLAIVSHELRSPLNALKGWSHVLSGTAKPDAALISRAVQAIKRNVAQQTRLIDDLLDTSRIVSGKLTLEKRAIDLVEVVRSAIDQSRGAAQAKRIELHFSAEQPVVTVEGDPGRLQQAVLNLLSNALKFTADDGQVEVGLRCNGERVELAVTDTGIGIDADFLPHVFDRFSQADSSTTRPYWGLGIGLALVRHLVELHGGTVRALSPGAGRGSTFTVELPAARGAIASQRPIAGEESYQAGEVLRGVRVLVVDDDADAREALQFALEQAGAQVATFDSGRALFKALDAEPPPGLRPVLVLDIAMPGEDGFSVLAQVREHDRLRDMPAIAVTALTHLDRHQFARAGFQESLGKPLDPQRLVKAILALPPPGSGNEDSPSGKLAAS